MSENGRHSRDAASAVGALNGFELAEACRNTVKRARIVLRHEKDHVMQHQLHSLIGELEWCEREYGGKK